VEALNDLASAISQVAVSYVIQGSKNSSLRVIPELFFNFDFVT